MYIIKNAFKSITRSKVRNILIGIIITVITVSSCIALSIKNAANEVQQSYLNSYNVTAQLTLDRNSLRNNVRSSSETFNPREFMSSIQSLTAEEVMKYADSQYVKSYLLSIQTNMDSSVLTKVTEDTTATNTGDKQFRGEIPGGNASSGDFKVIGYNSLDAMTQFINSTYKITKGSMFSIDSTNNSCVISTELAEENSLDVGSTFTLNNPNNTAESYTFTVTGIYEDNSSDGEFSMFSGSANQILTNYTSLNSIATKSNEATDTKLNVQTNATFNLKDSSVVDAFTAELKTKGLSEYYTVTTNLESFTQSMAPLKNLSSFATTMLVIVLLIGGSILVILNMLNIRERKYEIGVLRAIGMKKRIVLSQFVLELLMVTGISIILGSVIGSVSSVPIANNMLKSEIAAQQTEQSQVQENFGGGANMPGRSQGGNMMNVFGKTTEVDYVDQINAVVDVKILAELALIGIVLTILSSSISMIFISRYTPLKILSNRT